LLRRFSILTPTRDRPEWLPRCIASVQAQTFKQYEHIIYDNGDSPVRHLVPDDDPHIRYVRGPADGPADAFQKTLDLACGEIIHPFSDDDQLPPDALEIVDSEIGDFEWLVGYTSFEDANGNRMFMLGGEVDVHRLAQNYYLGGAIYWRNSLTRRVGGFDLSYDGAADYDLYLRFARNAPAKFVPDMLYRYTDHPGTDSHVRAVNQMDKTARIQAAHG
jgi:glycosyltransferase involved in cell wall biosynthesis